MEKQEAMTYQEAFDGGVVREGHYFLVKYPDGREVLFRLVKREGKYVMWGMKTTKKILLVGKEGYDNFLTLADSQVRKEYSSEDAFEEIHALGLSERDHEVSSWEELDGILDEARKISGTPEDANMYYALASRCVGICSYYMHFYVFVVNSDGVNANNLYFSNSPANSNTYEVRPEATPKSTLLLKVNGCDGSEENPWICLNNQQGIQEKNTSNGAITCKDMADMSKDELLRRIQGIREQLEELKKYVENSK